MASVITFSHWCEGTSKAYGFLEASIKSCTTITTAYFYKHFHSLCHWNLTNAGPDFPESPDFSVLCYFLCYFHVRLEGVTPACIKKAKSAFRQYRLGFYH